MNTKDTPKTKRSILSLILFGPVWARNSLRNVFGAATHKHGAVAAEALQAVRDVYTPREYRKETFAQAVERLNLTPAVLKRRRWEIVMSSRACYGSALLVGLIALSAAWSGEVPQVLGALVMVSFAGVSGWVRAFRVWQIDQRRLMPLQEFTGHSDAWIV